MERWRGIAWMVPFGSLKVDSHPSRNFSPPVAAEQPATTGERHGGGSAPANSKGDQKPANRKLARAETNGNQRMSCQRMLPAATTKGTWRR